MEDVDIDIQLIEKRISADTVEAYAGERVVEIGGERSEKWSNFVFVSLKARVGLDEFYIRILLDKNQITDDVDIIPLARKRAHIMLRALAEKSSRWG